MFCLILYLRHGLRSCTRISLQEKFTAVFRFSQVSHQVSRLSDAALIGRTTVADFADQPIKDKYVFRTFRVVFPLRKLDFFSIELWFCAKCRCSFRTFCAETKQWCNWDLSSVLWTISLIFFLLHINRRLNTWTYRIFVWNFVNNGKHRRPSALLEIEKKNANLLKKSK